jgi:hypothetical protein
MRKRVRRAALDGLYEFTFKSCHHVPFLYVL